ncbi:MAG: thermonuclease family protein [Bacteroidetes bacterium]|nr:thermonuclease family protein [Bacteroidota bacterium]
MKLALLVIIATALFVGCSNTSTSPVTQYVEVDPLLDSATVVTVHRVVDGDTFDFLIGRDTIDIRILGMDAFETRHGARLDSQAARAGISVDSAYARGLRAKAFADSLLSGQKALLTRDFSEPNFDTYNRLLRNVYYYDGTKTKKYSDLLIQMGLALVD